MQLATARDEPTTQGRSETRETPRPGRQLRLEQTMAAQMSGGYAAPVPSMARSRSPPSVAPGARLTAPRRRTPRFDPLERFRTAATAVCVRARNRQCFGPHREAEASCTCIDARWAGGVRRRQVLAGQTRLAPVRPRHRIVEVPPRDPALALSRPARDAEQRPILLIFYVRVLITVRRRKVGRRLLEERGGVWLVREGGRGRWRGLELHLAARHTMLPYPLY
jgi:hypothetical protein